MNCKNILSRLHAYEDGELPEKPMREIEEHLRACPACRRELDRLRELGDILDSLTVPPLPQGLAIIVMAEARKRAPVFQEHKSFFPWEWQPLRWLFDMSVPLRLAAFAMVLLASLLGMFMSKELSATWNHQTSVTKTENLDGFEWFSPTPPASLSSAYLTLTLTTTDGQGGR